MGIGNGTVAARTFKLLIEELGMDERWMQHGLVGTGPLTNVFFSFTVGCRILRSTPSHLTALVVQCILLLDLRWLFSWRISENVPTGVGLQKVDRDTKFFLCNRKSTALQSKGANVAVITWHTLIS